MTLVPIVQRLLHRSNYRNRDVLFSTTPRPNSLQCSSSSTTLPCAKLSHQSSCPVRLAAPEIQSSCLIPAIHPRATPAEIFHCLLLSVAWPAAHCSFPSPVLDGPTLGSCLDPEQRHAPSAHFRRVSRSVTSPRLSLSLPKTLPRPKWIALTNHCALREAVNNPLARAL